jgi:hypothetical protein
MDYSENCTPIYWRWGMVGRAAFIIKKGPPAQIFIFIE